MSRLELNECVEQLEDLTDFCNEGITFSLSGYESVTGQWCMNFHAMDELDFLPFVDNWEYRVDSETFKEDIIRNVEKFIKVYNKHKPESSSS